MPLVVPFRSSSISLEVQGRSKAFAGMHIWEYDVYDLLMSIARCIRSSFAQGIRLLKAISKELAMQDHPSSDKEPS